MFMQLLTKIGTFAAHHQAIIAGVVTLCIVCITWGFEKMLEKYFFPKDSFYSYLAAVVGGVVLLYAIQHYILHAI